MDPFSIVENARRPPMPGLNEAAERVLNAMERFAVEQNNFCVYDDYPKGHDYDDDCDQLAKAYAAELDQRPVDEAWLRENCESKHGCCGNAIDFEMGNSVVIRFFQDGDIVCRTESWHPIGETRIRNPTRGLVTTLKRIGGGM